MKDLKCVSKKEQEEFLNSFSQVLCDVDGVLWLFLGSIPGAQDGISSLQKIGKKIAYVSNNCTKSLDVYLEQLKSAGFEADKNDIITPTLAMISYLKKQNFKKEIYVVGMTSLKKQLEEAGFKIAKNGPDLIEESIQELAFNTIDDNENVGAVITDIDVNVNYIKLQKAITYLKRPEVMFITGAPDNEVPIGPNCVLLGPGYFLKILEEMTGRMPYPLAKPSLNLNDYIREKLKIVDPSRVLFIGDSISVDMGFASKCGYKKLLVLSGVATRESIQNWTFPEEYKPDYYVDSLKIIHDIISGTNCSQ